METSHLWMADPTAISSENAPIVIQIIEISLLFLLPNEFKKNTIKFRVFEKYMDLMSEHILPYICTKFEGSCMNSEFRGEKLSDSLNDYAHI